MQDLAHWFCTYADPLALAHDTHSARTEVLAFGIINYSSWAPDDPSLARIFHICHGINSKLLMLLVLIHAAAALYHHFIQKDNVLRRMLPFGKVN